MFNLMTLQELLRTNVKQYNGVLCTIPDEPGLITSIGIDISNNNIDLSFKFECGAVSYSSDDLPIRCLTITTALKSTLRLLFGDLTRINEFSCEFDLSDSLCIQNLTQS
jgi:hypothetical protein